MNPISGTANKAGIPEMIDSYIDKEKFDYAVRATEYAGHASPRRQRMQVSMSRLPSVATEP